MELHQPPRTSARLPLEPRDSVLGLKAKVTLVVRSSLLEQAHYDGPLHGGIVPATQYATGPLSHLLAARRRQPVDLSGANPFAGLAERYPRAWACLDALTDTFADGGRGPPRLPAAPVPDLPSGDEVVAAAPADDDGLTLFSAIDPRFDQGLVDLLETAAEGDFLPVVRHEGPFHPRHCNVRAHSGDSVTRGCSRHSAGIATSRFPAVRLTLHLASAKGHERQQDSRRSANDRDWQRRIEALAQRHERAPSEP